MKDEMPMSLADVQQAIAPMLPGLLGIELVETTPDRVVGHLTVRPEVATSRGVRHGGAIMSLGDTPGAVGTFLNMRRGCTTTTIETSTKLLAAAG